MSKTSDLIKTEALELAVCFALLCAFWPSTLVFDFSYLLSLALPNLSGEELRAGAAN